MSKKITMFTNISLKNVAVIALALFAVFFAVSFASSVVGGGIFAANVAEACCGDDGGDGGGDSWPSIPVIPTCTFNPAVQTITEGDTATLNWSSNNAVSATIDNGVGNVNPNGSRNVSPTSDKTYRMTVTSQTGHTSFCVGTVLVIDPPIVRECTISVNTDTVNVGESVTVSWTTNGYDNITVNGETVPANGNKTFTNIQVSTIYNLLAQTSDGNHVCRQQVDVTCLFPDVACTLSGSPSRITAGDSAVLTWTTDNADIASINQGIGAVSLDGNMSVSPSDTTTYTLTATRGNDSIQCPFTIIVDPVIPDPECTFGADPSAITEGGSSVLTWTTSNAASASINQGIGAVSLNGNRTVSPTASANYTLTVVGTNGDTVTCPAPVTVNPKPEPVCSFSADPISIKRGESSVLTWTTANADTVVINQGIGSVALSGNETVSPTVTTTYTLSATGYGETVNCPVTIEVTEDPQLACSMSANPIEINRGESSVLTWTSSGAVNAAIDMGVGVVALSDSITVSPTDTTTYTLTVSDANSNRIFCPVTITVKNDDVTQCTMVSDKTTVTKGESAVLTWTTTKANTVDLEPGFGRVELNNSRTVTPDVTTTYTLQATGDNNTAYCPVTINVADDPIAPVCEHFTVTPDSFTNGTGGNVTLDWKALNADTVTIDQGIGSVATEGNTTTSVTQTTTYTLTATGSGGTITCPATVTVSTPSNLSCDAFTASPTQVIPGGSTELAWQTTGATEVSINNGVGTVSVDGSQSVNVPEDTTYTLTARDSQGNMVTCDAFVDTESGGGGGGSSSPRCDLDISDTKIKAGEEVTITWDNTRTNDMVLEDNRGNILVDTTKSSKYDEDEDSITVKPTRDTEYTMTVSRGSKDRVCRVEVETEDDVTVISTRTQEPQVAGISLSQVPYTGFEAGPILTFIFYTVLALWAGFIAYILVMRDQPVFGMTLGGDAKSNTSIEEWEQMVDDLQASEAAEEETVTETVVASAAPVATVPHNLPTGLPVEPEAQTGYQSTIGEAEFEKTPLTVLENVAHEHDTLLSSDALQFFVDAYDSDEERATALTTMIAAAKAKFPAEGGWLVLNRERVNQLQTSPAAESAVPQFTPEMRVGESSLAEAIVVGNVAAANAMIGNRPMFSVADAVSDFDAVYRARKGMPSNASDLLIETTKHLSDVQVETMIKALASALDGAYTDEEAAVKMAIIKAVQVVG